MRYSILLYSIEVRAFQMVPAALPSEGYADARNVHGGRLRRPRCSRGITARASCAPGRALLVSGRARYSTLLYYIP